MPKHQVSGLRRNTNHLAAAIIPIQADFLDPNSLQGLPETDILVYCAAPSRHSDPESYRATYLTGFANLLQALPSAPQHIFFTSSTSVYAQHQHQWVNETSATAATHTRGQVMLAAEQQVMRSPCPATIVRFSGIYGFDRLFLLNQVLAGNASADNSLSYTNRIHVDDCAGVLNHLIEKLYLGKKIENLYLASDNCPAPKHEVLHWLAQQTNSVLKNANAAQNVGSKRCDNQRLRDSGYDFIYPDYQRGYRAIIKRLNYSLKTW